jgi:hypothetical protein
VKIEINRLKGALTMKQYWKGISLLLTGAMLCMTTACGDWKSGIGETSSTPSTSQTIIDGNNAGYTNHTPESLCLMLTMADDYSIAYQTTQINGQSSEKGSYLLEKDNQHLKLSKLGGEEWDVSYYDLEEQKSYFLYADGWGSEDFRRKTYVMDLLMQLWQIDCQMVFEDDNYKVSELSADRFEIKDEVIKACLGNDTLAGSGQMVRSGNEYAFNLRTEGADTLNELSFTVKFESLDIDMPTAEFDADAKDSAELTPEQVFAKLKTAKHCSFSIHAQGKISEQLSVDREENLLKIDSQGATRYVDLVKGYEYTEVNGTWKKKSIVTTQVWATELAALEDANYSYFFRDNHYDIGEKDYRYDLNDSILLSLSNSHGVMYSYGYMGYGLDLSADSYDFYLPGYGAMPGQTTTVYIHIDFYGCTIELPI